MDYIICLRNHFNIGENPYETAINIQLQSASQTAAKVK